MPPAGETTAALGRAEVSPVAGAPVEIDISKIGPGESTLLIGEDQETKAA
jgi:hypothetical protein